VQATENIIPNRRTKLIGRMVIPVTAGSTLVGSDLVILFGLAKGTAVPLRLADGLPEANGKDSNRRPIGRCHIETPFRPNPCLAKKAGPSRLFLRLI